MRQSGKLSINLASAIQAVASDQGSELTLTQLVRAFTSVRLDGSDLRLKKWTEAFGDQSAWAITSEQLETAAAAMLEHGYAPASVNRDLSSLGSTYRWAKTRRLAPRGFKSPTLGVSRFDEPIRRVHIEAKDLEKLRARAWRFRTDAPTTKNGTPRVLFFSQTTEELIRRSCPKRPPEALLFEGLVPGQAISFRRAWTILVQDVGLADLHMHDIRRAAAANLLKAGVTLAVAAQVLGHDPAVLARRYGHLETATLRKAQEESWRRTTENSGPRP